MSVAGHLSSLMRLMTCVDDQPGWVLQGSQIDADGDEGDLSHPFRSQTPATIHVLPGRRDVKYKQARS